jgi:hypothetical protein
MCYIHGVHTKSFDHTSEGIEVSKVIFVLPTY